MRLLAFAATVGLAVSSGLILAPAHAATLEYNLAVSTDASNCLPFYAYKSDPYEVYGQACINADDDIIIKDRLADSHSVAVHWRFTNGDRRGLCRWTGGEGTKGMCNKNFNNHKIEWRIGRCDSDAGDCTTTAGYRDWTAWNDTQPGET